MDYFHIIEDKQDLLKVSNLGLAYLGDAVYEVMVRSWLVLHGRLTPGKLHQSALAYVAAPRQAAMMEKRCLTSRGGDRLQTGPQRQPPLPPQGGHPPGVPDRHRPGGPVRLALSQRGQRPAQHPV